MKARWLIALGLVGGLLGAGILWLVSSLPRGQPVTLIPPPTSEPIYVHVVGAVARPGLLTLPPGARIHDAIQAAGGLLPEANSQSLNLAEPLQDGQQVFVPFQPSSTALSASTSPSGQGAPIQATAFAPASPTLPTSTSLSTYGGKIDLNTASLEELDRLPNIGPVLAQRIIDYRQAHGSFQTIEAIQDVAGIGPTIFERIKDLIMVGAPP